MEKTIQQNASKNAKPRLRAAWLTFCVGATKLIPSQYRAALDERLSVIKSIGKPMDNDAAIRLFDSVGEHAWLSELFSEYPLIGMRIGIKDPELDELMFELSDVNVLDDLNYESYPGKYLFGKGYVVIGFGELNAGDVLMLDCNGESIIPYQLWHDVSHESDELIAALRDGRPGTKRLASDFKNLIINGVMVEPWES